MASTAVSRTKIPAKPTTTARLRAVWFTGLPRSAVSGLGFRFGERAGIERAGMECCEQSFGGWVWLVPLGEVGAVVAGGLGGDPDVAHVGAAGEGEAGDEGDADPSADEGAHEAVVAGAAGDTGMEAADGSEHVQDAADLAPPVDPAFAGRRRRGQLRRRTTDPAHTHPILRTPTATQLAALSYLTAAVTAVVFLAWY